MEDPEGAGLCRAVSGLLVLGFRPPLSLRLKALLAGSELGVDRRGRPDVLRCRGFGDDTRDGTCSDSISRLEELGRPFMTHRGIVVVLGLRQAQSCCIMISHR